MKIPNIVSILLFVCMCLLALTGCSKNANDSSVSFQGDSSELSESGTTVSADGQSEEIEAQTVSLENIELARSFLTDLLAANFSDLEETYTFDVEMQALLSNGQLEGQLNAYLTQAGELVRMEDEKTSIVEDYQLVIIPCVFANASYDFQVTLLADGTIAGVYMGQYCGIADSGNDTDSTLPEGLKEVELNLVIDQEHQLPGTLTLPEGDGPFAVVILVHGSGASDQDETIGQNTPFKDLAWGLAKQGIAVYRYDKRTYVYADEYAFDQTITLYEETVDDAVLAEGLMREQSVIDSDRIYIAGHSLGGYAIPLIAKEGEANGYILLAASARPLTDLMKEQIDYLINLDGQVSDEEISYQEDWLSSIDKIENGEYEEGQLLLGAYKDYWEFLKSYNPIETAQEIKTPVLVLQGEEDYQVTMEDYSIWQEAFTEKENWSFICYPGLNHLLMEGSLTNGPADYEIKKTVSGELIDDIVEFINESSK